MQHLARSNIICNSIRAAAFHLIIHAAASALQQLHCSSRAGAHGAGGLARGGADLMKAVFEKGCFGVGSGDVLGTCISTKKGV